MDPQALRRSAQKALEWASEGSNKRVIGGGLQLLRETISEELKTLLLKLRRVEKEEERR